MRRSHYLAMARRFLSYLNSTDWFNCAYCA